MKIVVEKTSDWWYLSRLGLETVVDPMVFRCGERFQQGAGGVANPDVTWELLQANIHTIGMFFDCLILNEKLPVFNYGDTFDSQLDFEQRVLTRINDYAGEDVLYNVDVQYNAYHEVKTAAIDEMMKAFEEGPAKFQQSTADQIISVLGELDRADYEWSPNLGRLQYELVSEEQKRIAAFFLGGLIFSGYAQIMEGDHLLQPKRSQLLLAAALQGRSADYKLQEVLFDELKKRANTLCEDLPWRPTFFPYLLDKADTPTDLLKEVVKLRRSGEVADYRAWLKEVMHDWHKNRKISTQKKKDVRAIAKRVDQLLGIIPSSPQVEVKVTLADVTTLTPPGSVDFTPTLSRLWGWFLASLPGKRYQKLLTRAIVADSEYYDLYQRVQTVWRAG